MNEKTRNEILYFLQKIPPKKVATYNFIAKKFGVHPRAVASVLKYNKNPEKYPCYKVIAASGKISGYSAEGGVNTKIQKLLADDIEIAHGKVFEEYILR